jgi:hypothetical protein
MNEKRHTREKWSLGNGENAEIAQNPENNASVLFVCEKNINCVWT